MCSFCSSFWACNKKLSRAFCEISYVTCPYAGPQMCDLWYPKICQKNVSVSGTPFDPNVYRMISNGCLVVMVVSTFSMFNLAEQGFEGLLVVSLFKVCPFKANDRHQQAKDGKELHPASSAYFVLMNMFPKFQDQWFKKTLKPKGKNHTMTTQNTHGDNMSLSTEK